MSKLNTKNNVLYSEMFKTQEPDGTWSLKIRTSWWEQPSNDMVTVAKEIVIKEGLLCEPMLDGTDYT